MTPRNTPELLDETLSLTLREVCHACGVHAEYVVELVAEGVLQPAPGIDVRAWRFDGIAVTRIQRALRLQHDLGINLPGVALALELLDELDRLRRHG
jgi:chaperone modulatory protein CbpM